MAIQFSVMAILYWQKNNLPAFTANATTRLPSNATVSRAPLRGASSAEASDGEMRNAPAKPAVQFTSSGPLALALDANCHESAPYP